MGAKNVASEDQKLDEEILGPSRNNLSTVFQ